MFSDKTILVTGADPSDRETVLQALGDDFHVVAAQTMGDALEHVGSSVHLIISQVNSDSCDGLELMRRWTLSQPETPFLMLVEQHETALAVDAMKRGAADCIVKPIDADDLRAATKQLHEPKELDSTPAADRQPPGGVRRKSSIDIPPDTSLEELERAAVEQALIQHQGNRTHAARTLGISVRTLQRKLKSWGLPLMSLSPPVLHHNYLVGASTDTHSVSAHVH